MATNITDLRAAKAHTELKSDAIRDHLLGDCGLGDGLGLDDEQVSQLRRQACVLYESGEWARCIELVLAIVALGRVHPADPIMLSRCYRQLGKMAAAEECHDHATRLLEAMDIRIDFEKPEGGAERA